MSSPESSRPTGNRPQSTKRKVVTASIGLVFTAVVGVLIGVASTAHPVVPAQEGVKPHAAGAMPLWVCDDAPKWVEGAFKAQEKRLSLGFPMPMRGPCTATCKDSRGSYRCRPGYVTIEGITGFPIDDEHVGETRVWTGPDGHVREALIRVPVVEPPVADLILAHLLTHSRGLGHVKSSNGVGSFRDHLMYATTDHIGTKTEGIP